MDDADACHDQGGSEGRCVGVFGGVWSVWGSAREEDEEEEESINIRNGSVTWRRGKRA
jgi:hypothetical protein